MNCLLYEPGECGPDGSLRLTGRRAEHIRAVLRAAPGDRLIAGEIGGRLGSAAVCAVGSDAVELRVTPERDPPAPLPLTLVLALPRPKVLRRVVAGATALGVKRIHLVNTYRVEKSYWGTPFLSAAWLRRCMVAGLEQAVDTALPEIVVEKRFRPFVEDRLPAIVDGTTALVAHPDALETVPVTVAPPVTLAVGPEGGFIPYEVDKLQQAGFRPFSAGPRILRVEDAVPFLAGMLRLPG